MPQFTIDDTMHIEELIDACGLDKLLELIGDICYEKGAHLRTNWQDEETARHWDRAAAKVDGLSSDLWVLKVSI